MDPIKKVQIEALNRIILFHKTFIIVIAKCLDYSNIFLAKNIVELPKNTKINDYTIKLEKDNQQFFSPIYSLELVELKIFKTYIKINLVNNFISTFQISCQSNYSI